MHQHSSIDRFLSHVDRALRAMLAETNINTEPSPADTVDSDLELTEKEKQLSARLMRVNHAGEMAAQGLYHGHELTTRNQYIKQQMHKSALEEQAHLDWCRKRLAELDDRPSILDPFWYLGSYAIGASTGVFGDKWSLGFVSETEKQVVQHLDKHLSRLPEHDKKSREILLKMREDEARHDNSAQEAGAKELPKPAKALMKALSKVMTKSSYWL